MSHPRHEVGTSPDFEWRGDRLVEVGYVGWCICGWASTAVFITQEGAEVDAFAHMGRADWRRPIIDVPLPP